MRIRGWILHLLADLQKEFQMGLLLITHDLGIVARVADRVCTMYAGQFVEQAGVHELFRNPLHPYTRGLLECIPVPGKTPRGSYLGSIPGIVPSLIGDLKGCSFRDRCRFVRDGCEHDIALKQVGDAGRTYRCIMSPEQSTRAEADEAAGAMAT